MTKGRSGLAFREMTEHYFLSCNHEVTFTSPLPHMGDEIMCYRCNLPARVKSLMFKFRCFKCQYSRGFGLNEREMRRQANKHLVRWPDHIVGLFNPEGELITKWRGREPGTLFEGIAASD